ncbi:chromosome segregation protein SMC [Flindersiella endophytica]
MTLRGFKSFASSTTLHLEPGITCVVGPNGSGKSNVVDAIAWVMGEQGAKSLRGGKMEDVIFAGTTGRAPLGRAEVVLTIDNADGALPVDFAEVSISRIMFRNGGSEYAINGQTCRLLDVQELLSDSGIGREMHVIVGQGQLDGILHATPEDRRGYIEEAAGVLKHRKRKEKALRKLAAAEGNVTRLQDLLTEIRRQLKPLGKQAEAARRAAVIQADVRDARLRLLADDLVKLQSELAQELADETALKERRALLEEQLAAVREHEAGLDEALREDAPKVARAQETWYRLSSLKERLRGTASLAAERSRHLVETGEEQSSGRDPDQLEAEAAAIRETEAQIDAEVEGYSAALEAALEERQAAEDANAAEERRVAAALRAAADRREGLARLAGQVASARTRLETRAGEVDRLTKERADATQRADAAEREYTSIETQIAGLDAGESGLDEQYEVARDALQEIEQRLSELREQEQSADRERAALAARKEALELGLTRKDGAAALLAASDGLGGLVGAVAGLLTVEPGFEAAIAGALGEAADAVAVSSADAAVDALQHLHEHDLGRASILVSASPNGSGRQSWPALAYGTRYAIDVVTCSPELRPALERVLAKVAVVDDLAAARQLVASTPEVTAVTRGGDLLGAHLAYGGSASQPSLLEVQAAVDDAGERLQVAAARAEQLRSERSQVEAERTAAAEHVESTLSRLHESDARLAAVAEQLGQLGSTAKSARAEAERLGRSIEQAREADAKDESALEELEGRLEAAEEHPDGDEPATDERDRLAEQAKQARAREMEARLALRTAEERGRGIAGRAEALEKAAREERLARERARERRERRVREARVAASVLQGVERVLSRLERSLVDAKQEREAAEQARSAHEGQVQEVRKQVRALASELDELTDVVHKDEMARAQQRLRIEGMEQRALDELGMDPESLVAEYGPDQLIPPPPPAPGESEEDQESMPAEAKPFVRAEQEKRLKSAERQLTLLGKVNPLALEEFAALEERHKFLTEQLEDLKKTRRDLLEIVKEVDERVEQVFTEAYRDVEREFEDVFARLFPGGDGRLVLTDPSDMLSTGVEVEARPPGKKVKRLSLLSGGERSLVAVAFLVSLFKARPSPFYLLDEVEAALDDTNLGRLLEIYEELRENSQLLVVTHQKRTMEVADALYGISMRGDGVSAVISQRIREAESA